jgi:hypothetical protein
MKKRTQYKTNAAPDIKSKLLRLPGSLHQWFADEAKRHERSVNAEMVMALKFWRKIRGIK